MVVEESVPLEILVSNSVMGLMFSFKIIKLNGGAISLEGSADIFFYPNSTVTVENNTALRNGGAVTPFENSSVTFIGKTVEEPCVYFIVM